MASWLDESPLAPPPDGMPPAPGPAATPTATWLDEAPAAPAPGDAPLAGPAEPRTLASFLPPGVSAEPPPPPPDPEAQRAAGFLRWRDANTSLTPEKAAEALRYAAALGHDYPQWVADNLDAIKREVGAAQVPWQQLWEDHPALRAVIGDPVKAAAMRDESADLPWTEKYFTGGWVKKPEYEIDPMLGAVPVPGTGQTAAPAWAGAWQSGVDSMRLALRKAASANPFMRDMIEPWLNIGTGRTYDLAGFEKTNAAAKVELARSADRDFDTNLAGQVVLAVPKMLPSLLGAAAVGAVATASAPAAIIGAGGAALVGTGTKALYWALQGYGELHERLGEIRGPDGGKLDPISQEMLAVTFSLAAGVAMEFGLRPVAKGMGLSFERAAKTAVEKTGEAALANPTVARLFGRLALDSGKAVAAGAAAMGGQAAINETAMEFGKLSAAGDTDILNLGFGNIARAGYDGFVRAIPDMLILGMVGPTREVMRRRGEVLNAQVDAQRLADMGESARASKLRARFGAGYEELVRATAGEGPGAVGTVYATTERFDQVARARGAEPRDMAAAIIGDGGAAYDRAAQAGAPLEIPVEKYLTKVAVNPELEKQLLPDLRIDAQGRTLREAIQQKGRDLELMSRVMAEPISESDVAAAAVKKDFAEKAMATGRVTQEQADANGETVARMYRYAATRDRARALAAGEKPMSAFDFYVHLAPIELAGWREAEAARPSAGAPFVEPDRMTQAPAGGIDWSVLDVKRKELLQRALAGDQQAVLELHQASYFDRSTGLYSQRAHFDFLDDHPDPGGVHVYVDLPGLGQTNNRFGQSVGNTYVQRAGQALKAAAEATGARRQDRAGGDEFYFLFHTPEEAKAFLEDAKGRFQGLGPLTEGFPALSYYGGVGGSARQAELQLSASKVEAKGIHGDSKVDPAAIGHGKFYVNEDLAGVRPLVLEPRDLPPEARAAADQVVAKGGQVVASTGDGALVSVDRKGLETLAQAAYHGTPHVFDRFSLEHVGNGQGAQSFGWGLYFAENRGIAEGYRKALSGAYETRFSKGGLELSREQALAVYFKPGRVVEGYGGHDKVLAFYPDAAALAAAGEPTWPGWGVKVISTDAQGEPIRGERARTHATYPEERPLTRALAAEGYQATKGQLYKVEVPDQQHLLDYNLLLDEQPPGIVEKLRAAKLLPLAEVRQVPAGEHRWNVSINEGPGWTVALVFEPGGDPVNSGHRFATKAEAVASLEDLKKNRSFSEGYFNDSGRGLYGLLEEKLGSPEAASRALGRAGIPGLQYLDANSRGAEGGAHNFVVWDEGSIRTLETLYQKKPGGDRGSVVFTPLEGGQGVKASIDLFTSSDPSTLAHETAHVFGRLLEVLASKKGATEEVRADYQALLDAMGYKTQAEREAARAERQQLQGQVFPEPGGAEHQAAQARLGELAAKEERLAYLWEQYLLEGKAPEAAMAGPMDRFKGWLVKVYRSVTGLQETFRGQYGEELGALKPETKALFDRLLTAEDAVRGADTSAGLEALPGADPEVQAAFAAARADAEQRVLAALVEGDRKANSEMMQAERDRLRAEVAPVVDGDPVQAVVRVLQEGGTEGIRGPGGAALRLNRAALTKVYGAELVRALAKEHPGIFAPKGEGMKADDVAGLLGFENGADLVAKLTATRNRDAVVEAEVQRRMELRFGPPLIHDAAAIAERALQAAATPKAAAAIIKEMSRLRRDLADPTAEVRSRGVSWVQMVAAADEMVRTGKVGELTPGRHWNSMQAAGRRAFEAMQAAAESKTDKGRQAATQRAYEERDQQLWAMAMANAAETVKADLEQRQAEVVRSGRTAWRSELGKADPAFVGAHDSILEAVGLGTAPPDTSGTRGNLDQALAKATADAADIDFDVATIREVIASKTPWRELTVAQAIEVSNAVQNLRTIANNANEMTILGRRIQRAQWLDRAEAAVGAALPLQPKFEDDPKVMGRLDRVLQAARMTGQSIDALLLDVATVAHILDGGNRDGPFHQVFVDNRLACRDKRADLTRAFLVSIEKAFEKSGLERSRLYEVLSVGEQLPLSEQMGGVRKGETRTRANLIMMALNLGNDSNAERFLKGYGWERQQVLDVLSKHLNGKELRWVNDVWAALEGKGDGPSLYEEMARVHQEETGLRPEKIVARPFTLHSADGELVEMTGGYFPARYDPRPSGKETKTGEKQVEDTVSAFFGGGYQREGLKPYSPHAKARAEHFQDAINLDWGVVPVHVSQVIQDIAYRGYARQTAALILDSRFKNLMEARFGVERAKWFEPWLKAVINQTSDALPADLRWSDRFMSGLRSRAAVASIGWSIPVALGDLTQPLTAVASGDISAKYLAIATAKQTANWGDTRAFFLDNSAEGRERGERLSNKFREAMAQMGGASGQEHPWIRGMRDTAFITMEMTDRLTTTPVWTAKYHQELAAGMTHEEAVRAADDTIRRVFPPEDIANKPRILRARGLSSFLLFYGYANKIWNVERESVHNAWRQWRSPEASIGDKAGAIARAAGTIAAVSLVNGVIGEYFSGRGPEQDEYESEWLARKLIASVFYPLPIVGAVGDWVGAKVVNLATGQHKPVPKMSIRNAPALSFAQDTFDRFAAATKAWEEGDQAAGEVALHTAELLIGLGVGAPMRQVEKTGKAALAELEGESTATGPLDALGNLVYGEGNRDNPLKWLQRRADGTPIDVR